MIVVGAPGLHAKRAYSVTTILMTQRKHIFLSCYRKDSDGQKRLCTHSRNILNYWHYLLSVWSFVFSKCVSPKMIMVKSCFKCFKIFCLYHFIYQTGCNLLSVRVVVTIRTLKPNILEKQEGVIVEYLTTQTIIIIIIILLKFFTF